jgi:hypothetical protein
MGGSDTYAGSEVLGTGTSDHERRNGRDEGSSTHIEERVIED